MTSDGSYSRNPAGHEKFGGLTANENVTFDVDRNTIVGIVGPNGAGKTTLFNSISGVHSLTSGQCDL